MLPAWFSTAASVGMAVAPSISRLIYPSVSLIVHPDMFGLLLHFLCSQILLSTVVYQ
jgi:hypothetical protein